MSGKNIEIDTNKWCCVLDSYSDVLRNVGAPDWHGSSIAALVDSIVYDGINELEPPYTLRFNDVSSLPEKIANEVRLAKQAIDEAKLERQASTGLDIDVEFEIV